MDDPQAHQRRLLADFIRAHRGRLKPADVGLALGSRRRTPGLRREEVAQLRGVSATWYTWIEQGRDVSVSPAALGRLAAALRLSRAERRYLFDLAGKRDPEGDTVAPDDQEPAALNAMVQAIALPAYVLDRAWRARAWNVRAAGLFVGWLDDLSEDPERNLLRYNFRSPAARSLRDDCERPARRVVPEIRADNSRHLDDPQTAALVEELRSHSEVFRQLWDEHAVLGREGGERTFNHPRLGFLRYEQMTFEVANRPDFKLVVLSHPPKAAAS
jgi:transcriptional regulator with XRE-family HTH domain